MSKTRVMRKLPVLNVRLGDELTKRRSKIPIRRWVRQLMPCLHTRRFCVGGKAGVFSSVFLLFVLRGSVPAIVFRPSETESHARRD